MRGNEGEGEWHGGGGDGGGRSMEAAADQGVVVCLERGFGVHTHPPSSAVRLL